MLAHMRTFRVAWTDRCAGGSFYNEWARMSARERTLRAHHKHTTRIIIGVAPVASAAIDRAHATWERGDRRIQGDKQRTAVVAAAAH
jgi:hypothetical protein